MLQIDPIQFLMQAGGLFVWVCIVAVVYAVVEKALGGPAAQDVPTDM
jgi:hypothetical protein